MGLWQPLTLRHATCSSGSDASTLASGGAVALSKARPERVSSRPASLLNPVLSCVRALPWTAPYLSVSTLCYAVWIRALCAIPH